MTETFTSDWNVRCHRCGWEGNIHNTKTKSQGHVYRYPDGEYDVDEELYPVCPACESENLEDME